MSLRSEVKEAMAVALKAHGYRIEADWVREEQQGSLGVWIVAQAALSVCDEYEGVGVQRGSHDPYFLRARGSICWESGEPSFTVYRKKQKPGPTLLEAAKGALKAMSHSTGRKFVAARDDLAAAIAKEK